MFISFVALNPKIPEGVLVSAPVANILEVYVTDKDNDRYTVKLSSGAQYAFMAPNKAALSANPVRPLDARSKGNKAVFAAIGIMLSELPLV